MGFLSKLKFWKKRNNKTPTKEEACDSTKDPQTCDATVVSVDPTKVDACVSTQEQLTCDGSTVTMEPITITVDADVSAEEQNKKRGRRRNRNRNNKTQTKVDACVSTEEQRTCDARTTTDSVVLCAAYTQTTTGMDGGAAAAAKRELKLKTQKIQELEEELALSRGFVTDVMLNMKSVEQQVRKYAEKPVINWEYDCECSQNLSSVTDLLKNFIERDIQKSDSEATCVRKTKVDCSSQTVSNNRQMNGDEQEAVRRLEDRNRQLTASVENYEKKIAVLKEDLESMEQDGQSHTQQIQRRCEEDLQRQILKMRGMREELLWYKEQCPRIRMPTSLNG